MNKIGIVKKDIRTDVQYYSDLIVKKMSEKNIEVWFDDKITNIPSHTDLIIVLGGDGTMLKTFRKFGKAEIPFLCINFGNIGFLSTIEPEDFLEYLPLILDEKYFIDERSVIHVSIFREGQNEVFDSFAFNDVIIKSVMPKISRQLIKINGNLFSKYEGDGVICATSTGSTAYSLSAGGSIVNPCLDAIVITPLCSRANLMNSMVISFEHKIEIICTDLFPCSILSADGSDVINLFNNDRISIQKADLKVKFVSFDKDRYFNLLYSKLWGWQPKKRLLK